MTKYLHQLNFKTGLSQLYHTDSSKTKRANSVDPDEVAHFEFSGCKPLYPNSAQDFNKQLNFAHIHAKIH